MLLKMDNGMVGDKTPVPKNEMERILTLSGFDLDYSDDQNNFQDLAKLAAKVAGTRMSLVNIIDSLTQWTISNYGIDLEQMMREDSVCQYTILEEDHFEVRDLSADDRFKDKSYVTNFPNAKYYYGIPLNVGNGLNIGALCVLDQEKKIFEPEKIEMLKIIAAEIVNRLKTFKVMEELKRKIFDADQTQKKLTHDIRGPLGGIVGLAGIIMEQQEDNQMPEILEFADLIHKSGNSILDLADEILGSEKQSNLGAMMNPINLTVFKDKLESLYQPQALSKNIHFHVRVNPETESILFSKSKLLQITGNLISNSVKFTPVGGSILVDLNLVMTEMDKTLIISVKDSGIGLTEEDIESILHGTAWSTDGTNGEQGFGFGLALVKHLVESKKGNLTIFSEVGNGATFTIKLPQI